jgi:hypothetical protein
LTSGWGELAHGVSDFGKGLVIREEEQARAWASNTLSQARLEWTDHLQKRQETAEPGAPEFTPGLIRDFDEYANDIVGKAPTNRAGRYLGERLSAFRSELGSHALTFEAKARIDYNNDQFMGAIDNSKKLMNKDPSQFPVVLAEQLAAIDGSALPPIQKSAIRQRAIDGISQAAVWSQIQRSPTAFLQSIGFGAPEEGKVRKSSGDLTGMTGNAAFDILPFEKRTLAFEAAIRQKAQVDADAEKSITALNKAQADDAMKEAYSRRADGKLTRDYIEEIRPVISHQDYRSLLDMSGRVSPQHSDPGTLRSIMRLMETDPDAARNAAYRAHQNGLLKDEGSDGLTGIVNHAMTLVRQGGPKTEYEMSRQYITGQLDPGPLVHDPVQRSRLGEALDMFDRWVGVGKHTDQEVRTRGREIVNQFKFIDLSQTVMALPSPRSGNIRRMPQDTAGMLQDIDAAGRTAQARRDAREYTNREYDEEMEILNKWRRTVSGGR